VIYRLADDWTHNEEAASKQSPRLARTLCLQSFSEWCSEVECVRLAWRWLTVGARWRAAGLRVARGALNSDRCRPLPWWRPAASRHTTRTITTASSSFINVRTTECTQYSQ